MFSYTTKSKPHEYTILYKLIILNKTVKKPINKKNMSVGNFFKTN